MQKTRKRFWFGIITIICASVTTVLLEYPPDVYFKIVSAITGAYLCSQTITDSIKRKDGV